MTRFPARFAATAAVLLIATAVRAHVNMDLAARLRVPPFLRSNTTERVEAIADIHAFDPASGVTFTVDIDAGTFTGASMPAPWKCTREARRVRCVADEAAAGPHELLLDVMTPASGTINFTATTVSIFGGDPMTSNDIVRLATRVYAPAACNAQAPTLVSASTTETAAHLVWSAVAGAAAYEVYGSLDGDLPRLLATTPATTASVRLLGGGDASWFVRAKLDACPALDSTVGSFNAGPAYPALVVSSIESGLFTEPVSVTLDGDYVLIGDAGQKSLRSYHIPTGSVFDEPFTAEWQTPLIHLDGGIAIGPGGFLYLADSANHLVRFAYPLNRAVFTAVGTPHAPGTADGLGPTARVRSPLGVVTDEFSRIFVADSGNNSIRRLFFDAPRGEFSATTIVGPSGGLNAPAGIAIDAGGNLIVADRGNHVIRRITPTGVVATVAGVLGEAGHRDGDATQALFRDPYGVGVDPWGNILVTEEGNHTVRRIAPNGRVTTVAGRPGVPGNSGGRGAAALFNRPGMLVVDANGVVWIADRGNGTLRRAVFAPPALRRRAMRH